MDFTFSPEQEQLRASVRAFLIAEAPTAYVRQMAEHDDAGITPAVWNQIVELGWTGLLVPERNGGLGLGVVDAVVVQEEMGRVPFPGPFFSSAILATHSASTSDSLHLPPGKNEARSPSTKPARATRSNGCECALTAVATAIGSTV